MLTEKEIALVKKCRFFHSESWGEKGKGLWPAGIVARARGVKFKLNYEFDYEPINYVSNEAANKSSKIREQALTDTYKAFKYPSRIRYLRALDTEGLAMLKRLT